MIFFKLTHFLSFLLFVKRLWEPPSSLRLDYWKRSPKTQEAKDSHIEYLETLPYSREELILRTVLKAGIPVAIEKNLFPYETPPNIEVLKLSFALSIDAFPNF